MKKTLATGMIAFAILAATETSATTVEKTLDTALIELSEDGTIRINNETTESMMDVETIIAVAGNGSCGFAWSC